MSEVPNLAEKDALYWNDKGLDFFGIYEYDKALECLNKALELDPEYIYSWYNKGLVLHAKELYNDAINCFDKCIEMKADYTNAWYAKALSLRNIKKLEDALTALNKALELDPNFYNMVYEKGSILFSIRKYEDAINSFNKALEIKPDSSDAWYSKGLAFFNLKRYEDAIDCYDKSIDIDSNIYDAWYYKGRALYALRKYEDAIDCYDKSIRINPIYPEVYYDKGLALEVLRKKEAYLYFDEYEKLKKGLTTGPFELKNLSAHIGNDIYSEKDSLGYNTQAIALSLFLVHPKTEAPIAISIQAPWGGGKTSFMRIVQSQLDNAASNTTSIEESNPIKLKDLVLELKILRKKLKSKIKTKIISLSGLEDLVKINDIRSKHGIDPKLTIWFNAWEYENTEQLWNGLVDVIIRGIIQRLNKVDQALFLLQLNLKAENLNDVWRWLSKHILLTLWKEIKPTLLVTVSGILISILTHILGLVNNSILLANTGLLGIFGSIIAGSIQFMKQRENVKDTSSNMSISNYLQIPDYSSKTGFIHSAVSDIRRVLKLIPSKYLPLVIFIDDLDRCSPTNITYLMEGINLLLANDFKECKFIIGMGSEIVASSLEVTHEQISEKLPYYSSHVPLGWKYLDKFIQLPIILPPPRQSSLNKFIEDLLAKKIVQHQGNINHQNVDRDDAINRAENLKQEMVNKINILSDDDPDILVQLSKATYYFSNNAREIKRFLNLIRYYRFLKIIIEDLKIEKDLPSLDQIRRWVILLMRWPALVRWLYWSPGGMMTHEMIPELLPNPIYIRLKQLEKLAGKLKNQKQWEEAIKAELDIAGKIENMYWLSDKNLREFFQVENQLPEMNRLSSGAGKGIY